MWALAVSTRTLSSLYVPDVLMQARPGCARHLVPRSGAYTWCGVLAGSMRAVWFAQPFPHNGILDICCPACKVAVTAAYLRLED